MALVGEFPRYGYRMITRQLRREGCNVNFKRIYRLWKREDLKVPVKKAKKRRLGNSDGGIVRRKAERPIHVWSIDFIFDRTENGRPLKVLSVIDEFTRECIALEVHRRFTSDDLVCVLSDLFTIRGIPSFIRSDNGPEFISKSVRYFSGSLKSGPPTSNPAAPGKMDTWRVSLVDCVTNVWPANYYSGSMNQNHHPALASNLQPPPSA